MAHNVLQLILKRYLQRIYSLQVLVDLVSINSTLIREPYPQRTNGLTILITKSMNSTSAL